MSEGGVMQRKPLVLCAIAIAITGCGSSEPAEPPPEQAERRPTVFDPLTSTIQRAEGVQQTVEEQAAEQRRRIEEAER
jgi:hypothetical protein